MRAWYTATEGGISMVKRLLFTTENVAWEFAKSVVRAGGTVIDYGVVDGGYYILFNDNSED